LLALVESYLEKQPDKTFSDLCKEALWQSLCVPESVRPSPKPTAAQVTSAEPEIAELQRQMADLEERYFARESNRLEAMERQLLQLSQQVAQLALMASQAPTIQPPSYSAQMPAVEVINTPPAHAAVAANSVPQEVDPVISRLSQFLDDF
jgi:hypothetical protein